MVGFDSPVECLKLYMCQTLFPILLINMKPLNIVFSGMHVFIVKYAILVKTAIEISGIRVLSLKAKKNNVRNAGELLKGTNCRQNH